MATVNSNVRDPLPMLDVVRLLKKSDVEVNLANAFSVLGIKGAERYQHVYNLVLQSVSSFSPDEQKELGDTPEEAALNHLCNIIQVIIGRE